MLDVNDTTFTGHGEFGHGIQRKGDEIEARLKLLQTGGPDATPVIKVGNLRTGFSRGPCPKQSSAWKCIV